MKIVTIDKEAKSMPGRTPARPSSRSSPPGPPGTRRMVRALLSVGAVLMMGWLISTLATETPKSGSPSSKLIAATRVTHPSEEMGGPTPNAAVPSLGVTNYPPKILSVEILPAKPHIGDELEARAEAFDADGDPVQFSYTWVVNGQIAAKGTGPNFSGSDLHKHDRVVARVVPSDGKLNGVEGSSQPVMITNRPPLITSAPSTTMKGGVYTYTVAAKDPDGDALQFRLSQAPEGMTIQPETGLIQWKVSTEQPAVDINVVASDGDGAEAFQQFKLTVHSGS